MINRELMMDIARSITAMEKGMWLDVSRTKLEAIWSVQLQGMFGPTWLPEEWIMENVVGSTYNVEMVKDPATGTVTFKKLMFESKEPLYISPDRLWRSIEAKGEVSK